MAKELLQWHPGFYAAFDVEMKKAAVNLKTQNEYTLGTKPTVIDLLAVDEGAEYPFSKNIIQIFRRHNIIEYKSPKESLSINDYYKVMSYACYYIANTDHVLGIKPWEVTITFVCNRYPREMLKHLQNEYGYVMEKAEQGIYYLRGCWLPVQMIINHELNPEKNLWLYSLRGNLTEEEIDAVMEDYRKHMGEKEYQSAMNLIAKANWKKIRKADDKMCEVLKELCKEMFGDEMEEEIERRSRLVVQQAREEAMQAGMQQGEQRGEWNKIISLIKKKLMKGKTAEVIAEELEEEVTVIHELIGQIMQAAN